MDNNTNADVVNNGLLLDENSIERKIKKQTLIIQVCLFALFILILFGFWLQEQRRIANQEYINGNVLRISALHSEGKTMDKMILGNPWLSSDLSAQLLFRRIFNTDHTFTKVIPSLGENLEILDNGYTYIFKMRDNQFWSDGTPITVDDVVFSFEAFFKNRSVNSLILWSFSNIEGALEYKDGKAESISGISIVDGNKIKIKLKKSDSNFRLMLTQFTPLPKHKLANDKPTEITNFHHFFYNNYGTYSGEFMIEGFDKDQNIVAVKNPYYTDQAGSIEKVLFCWDIYGEELDYYPTSSMAEMITYRSRKGYVEHDVDVYFYRYFLFNTQRIFEFENDDIGSENIPMRDIRIRRALNHAIDIQAIIDLIYQGKSRQIFGGDINIAKEYYEYSPLKAERLLKEANYDFNRPITIGYYSGDTSSKVLLNEVQKYFEAIGLQVLLYHYTVPEIFTKPRHDILLKNLSAFNTVEWYAEYLSTNSFISLVLGKEGLFDDLISELTYTTDNDVYQETLHKLVDLEQEVLHKLPLFLLTEAIYVNANRVSLPKDIIFGNTRYFSDIRFNEWSIKKK